MRLCCWLRRFVRVRVLRCRSQTNRAHTSAHSQRMLTARSQRVKSVDVHPREPWVLSALFDGKVYIWNYQTQALVKSFELIELPGCTEQSACWQ
jgi:WD40 repeat protein